MIDQSSESFLEACGSTGPLDLGLEQPGAPDVLWRGFEEPFVVVGREEGVDLPLNHPDVSRRHAYLQMIAGQWICIDLQSRTGTHWEDGPRAWGRVGRKRGIRVGPYRIRPRCDEPLPSPRAETPGDLIPTSGSSEQPPLAEAVLELLDPASGPSNWRISRAVVLLGRSPVCKVQLAGPGVSRIHASFVRRPTGVWVVDLLGSGGILVNEARVRCARLENDDELRVGPYRIRVRCGPIAARNAGLVALPANRRGWGGSPDGLATSVPVPLPSHLNSAGSGLEAIPAPDRGGGWYLAGPDEGPESLVRAMLGGFGQMQQQMGDQFQQALVGIFRMFTDMHQGQMALVREELARIRELTEVQQALLAQLTGRLPSLGELPSPPIELPPGPKPNARATPPAGAPSRPRPSVADQRRVGAADSTAPAMGEARSQPSSGPDQSVLHAELLERLASLENERQGRWQKLLESLTGRGQ